MKISLNLRLLAWTNNNPISFAFEEKNMKTMRAKAEFNCKTGHLLFDVTIRKEESTDRTTFFFVASDKTKEQFDLFNEGIIRVVCDNEKTPNVFSIPSHDPKLKRELVVYIHDFISAHKFPEVKGKA
jgi:hypothetical protein